MVQAMDMAMGMDMVMVQAMDMVMGMDMVMVQAMDMVMGMDMVRAMDMVMVQAMVQAQSAGAGTREVTSISSVTRRERTVMGPPAAPAAVILTR
ncbi:uncharacterized protein ACO6RY_08258 [Pungitius sinensis]